MSGKYKEIVRANKKGTWVRFLFVQLRRLAALVRWAGAESSIYLSSHKRGGIMGAQSQVLHLLHKVFLNVIQ